MIYPKQIPKFVKNIHYEELHPKVGKYRYRYTTLVDITLEFHNSIIPDNQVITFSDDKGSVWLTIGHKYITIPKNYAWDGCTPKKWFGFWWGVPDFDKTITASLIHDALLQFIHTENFPISRYMCDNIFKHILYVEKFKFAELYYMGVRVGSRISSSNKYVGKSELTTLSKD